MIWKLLGVILILLIGAVSALGAVHYEKRRLSVLDGWLDLIQYIRAQIDCYLKPMKEILEESRPELFEACLSPSPPGDLEAVLKHSAVYLDGDGKRLAEDFVKEIGSSYREDQLRRCDYYLDGMRRQRERIAAELPSRIRMCAGICLCISLGAAILLW